MSPSGEDGRGAPEYAGAAAVVAIVVTALVTSGLGRAIFTALLRILRSVAGLGG
jgi:hypothetical protein